jgi:uncharacterized protein DUF4136
MKPLRTMLVVLALALAIAGCSTVSVTNQWRDPQFAGPAATNFVVVGIARNETTRRVFEDTFVAELRKAGVQAQPAYTQIEAGENGKVKLTDLVRASGADAVLTTRVQRVQQKVDVSPGYYYGGYGGFYGWYGGAWASAPTVSQYEVVTLETNVWDPKSGTLIWAATTERVASPDIPKVTTQLAEALIPRMRADHILR